MVFGTTPFRASRREQTFHNIINQPLTFPATPAVSPELRDLVTKLLMRDPSQRLGTQAGSVYLCYLYHRTHSLHPPPWSYTRSLLRGLATRSLNERLFRVSVYPYTLTAFSPLAWPLVP